MTRSQPNNQFSSLSEYEVKCLRLYAGGQSMLEIAKELRCTEFSIQFIFKCVKEKLYSKNLAQVVAIAIKEGLI